MNITYSSPTHCRDVLGTDSTSEKTLAYDEKHRTRFQSIVGDTKQLVALVIDEISQLSTNNLYHADQRLQRIMDCKLPFGGLIVRPTDAA